MSVDTNPKPYKIEKINLLYKLREGICSKKQRGVSCPKPKHVPFEPEFKHCGLPQVVASNVSVFP